MLGLAAVKGFRSQDKLITEKRWSQDWLFVTFLSLPMNRSLTLVQALNGSLTSTHVYSILKLLIMNELPKCYYFSPKAGLGTTVTLIFLELKFIVYYAIFSLIWLCD